LLQIAGKKRNALRYEIGNPLTASKMTRDRLVLFEDEQGGGIFEYDKPSSFFGQFGEERVTAVGRYLDATLDAVLRSARHGNNKTIAKIERYAHGVTKA
jgi:hypothetical protein